MSTHAPTGVPAAAPHANHHSHLQVGAAPVVEADSTVSGAFVQIEGEHYYCIRHYDQMPPFFISLVSSADHWLFIASTGGLTAGRVDADNALFPYETEDKVSASFEQTGSKTLVRVTRDGQTSLWEPFSERYAGIYRRERHLYKHIYGHKLIFEEINHDLQLTFRYAWRTSGRFGFVRTCWLHNTGAPATFELLDGLQNVLPHGATQTLQTTMSSLLNAYKRSELHAPSGLAIFALSATLTDRAEPSESLRATVAWQTGLDNPLTLLARDQVNAFRHGRPLRAEHDVRGHAGAYLLNTTLTLAADATHRWHIVADVHQDTAAVANLARWLQTEPAPAQQIEHDIAQGGAELVRLVAAADGLQHSAQQATDVHHFANVLFNIMRGGIFANGYQVEKADLLAFVATRNRAVLAAHADWFAALPTTLPIATLYAHAAATQAADLIRLCYEYLPLSFSRRHGDPSRPWNHFAINLRHADGSPRLDYQGNWRDIFQNWEPLALAFPHFLPGMVAKFLNATTVDGYNPYRVTRAGIEWEEPEPHNPWSNIGYWSDHQIIYLQKLLEMMQHQQPGALAALWRQPIFATAAVPYRLRSYDAMLADWYNTVDYDYAQAGTIATRVGAIGTDGRLLHDANGHVAHVTLAEKLLTLLLTKLTNLVPGGGIWMNTQRPEWNDANNALVGKGLSVVTTAYVRRFVAFWRGLLREQPAAPFALSEPVATLFDAVHAILRTHAADVATALGDTGRKRVMDALGAAISAYRATVYADGLGTHTRAIDHAALVDLLEAALVLIDATLHANRRADDLYHTYNTLRIEGEQAAIDRLYVMLEGQVAILSAGLLPAEASARLLRALPASDLYRADQHSYMLYPNRTLPGFLAKNHVPAARVAHSALVPALVAAGDRRLLIRDAAGDYHFPGTFRNAGDVVVALQALEDDPAFSALVAAERASMLALFEATFNHSSFTGRSGTFFAYEGLGSIYWHMVSKLLLAAQEAYQQALASGADDDVVTALADAYREIRAGLGFNKTPAVYGAFPTDPYSHTPIGRGAQQPGMTGLVKEEILTRWGELGVSLQHGALCFAPTLLRDDEFLTQEDRFTYVNVYGAAATLLLPAGSLAFTFCQVPVVYRRGDAAQIELQYADGRTARVPGGCLDAPTTAHILNRDARIVQLHVTITH